MNTIKTTAALTLLFSIAGIGYAQGRKNLTQEERNRFLVSAKAGKVSIAEGDVSIKRRNQWEIAIAGDDLKNSELVKTGSESKAEILLNPGSYLRLAEETTVEFLDTSLDRIKFQIVKGSAIVEESTYEGAEGTLATVTTPSAQFAIVKGGIYRFDVQEDGTCRADVRKGRMLMIGKTASSLSSPEKPAWVAISAGGGRRLVQGFVVKEGKRVFVDERDSADVASFDKKKETDDFDLWSKDRARALVAANKRLPDAVSGLSFAGGLWIFDPFQSCYTFLPGWYGFASPYGWSYPTNTGYWAPGHNSTPHNWSNHGPDPRAGGTSGGSGSTGSTGSSGGSRGGSTPAGGTWSGGAVSGGGARPSPSSQGAAPTSGRKN